MKRDGFLKDVISGRNVNGRDRWLLRGQLLFQRRYGMENRPIPAHAVRKILHIALAAAGLTDASGSPLRSASVGVDGFRVKRFAGGGGG